MSVRLRPSAQSKLMPSCVVVARRTLDPLALVRIQARQLIKSGSLEKLRFSRMECSPVAQR